MGYRQSSLESMVINKTFWKDKHVFVTGHTGFKGSWLSLLLQNLGARVTGYSLQPPTNPSLFELANVVDGMHSIEGDVRDLDHLRSAMRETHPEIVIHMAAQPIVRQSYQNPVETYSTNVMGTVNLLESVRQTEGVRSVINVTSDKCYENKEWIWGYRENEPMGGYDPYSNSKGCSELITSAFRNSFFHPNDYQKHGVAVASARAGNVIGGGDWAESRLIPDCINKWLAGEIVTIRYPQAVRPWQHVLEPLCGYLQLAERLYVLGSQFAEAWNFGPKEQDSQSVQYIVQNLAILWKGGAHWNIDSSPQPHEANFLKLDSSKANNLLKWFPRWRIESTLEKIAEWYQVYQENPQSIRKITLQQIETYSKGD